MIPMTDEMIEKVARGMCAQMRLDPEERKPAGAFDTKTDRQMAEMTNTTLYDVCLYEPRWALMRRDAARAIAAHNAILAVSGE